jgi:hypothetical protein
MPSPIQKLPAMDFIKLILVLHFFTTDRYLNSVEAVKHIPPMVRRGDASVPFFEKNNTSDFIALMDRPKSDEKNVNRIQGLL